MIRQIRPVNRKTLEQGLKRLKLRHTRDELDALSDLALSEEPSYLDFLAHVVDREIVGREATQRAKRLKAARFPAHRTLEGFDFTFQTSVSPQTMRDLADQSVTQHLNRLMRNDLLILDELGMLTLDQTGSDHLFQFVAKAYETTSLAITSNLDFQGWGQIFNSSSTAAAVLDRLLHHAHVLVLRGESYRVRSRLVPVATTAKNITDDPGQSA